MLDSEPFKGLPAGARVLVEPSHRFVTRVDPADWQDGTVLRTNHHGNLVVRHGDRTGQFCGSGWGRGQTSARLLPATPENLARRDDAVRRRRAIIRIAKLSPGKLTTEQLEAIAALIPDEAVAPPGPLE